MEPKRDTLLKGFGRLVGRTCTPAGMKERALGFRKMRY